MRLSISRAVRPLAARCVLAAPISTEKFVTQDKYKAVYEQSSPEIYNEVGRA
jgi:hypothetical protein